VASAIFFIIFPILQVVRAIQILMQPYLREEVEAVTSAQQCPTFDTSEPEPRRRIARNWAPEGLNIGIPTVLLALPGLDALVEGESLAVMAEGASTATDARCRREAVQ
jgi:hypothetical protein